MKKFHLFTFLFFSFLTVSVHSQIITDTEENTTELKKKKEPIDTLKSTITEVYFGSTWMNNFRSLEINSGIFEQPLGERLNEKHLNTWAYHIGFRQYNKKPFFLEAGVSLSKNGESYFRYEWKLKLKFFFLFKIIVCYILIDDIWVEQPE